MDVGTTAATLKHAAANVGTWTQSEDVEAPAAGMQTRIEHQPLGVDGIISPWNFPINLAFAPLAGVFAAGNAALIKPSELTPATSELLAELIAEYFDPMDLGVVLGDAEVGKAFSELPFDHLVFTGSTSVGRHVMHAAANNLLPLLLVTFVVKYGFGVALAVSPALSFNGSFSAAYLLLCGGFSGIIMRLWPNNSFKLTPLRCAA
ncbi:MAG: Coniferyl aldehyde dehydrogenase [Stenotrophomonas maltophilia]|uniref:Coniferyl aldehyde dehydrogenase n=1 Tax=Stenotrophomonas maltophilia TaxID=40324 RepID=A0A7V8FGP5_STEMA|nr:MAG: Coniferyl aldehyde dehydrogenase [Stenotrophomonas maltophilia]